jgi:signal peptidase II
MKKRYLIVGLIILIGLVIDLVSKSIFASILMYGEKEIVLIPNLLTFTYVENDGAAYGMLGGRTWLLIVVTIIFVIAFVAYFVSSKTSNWWHNIGIALILSGAVGNFVDRIFFKGIVRDFIHIKFFDFVFNLADMYITFGVICFGVYIIIEMVKEIKEKKSKEEKNDSQDK